MLFSEFFPGQVIAAGPEVIGEHQIIAFAREYDPQWFHVDRDRAERGAWRGLIASGWQTCAIAMRMVCTAALVESNSIGSPGLAYVKWENAVRPGDELRLRITVIETRVAQSRPDLGIIRWRWSMFNQRHEPVLDLEATSLFDLASHPTANPPI
jgi:acyl dehydratase